jgi:chemosensory pili system protein ChpA (sensor histidine kinase/response regulator)
MLDTTLTDSSQPEAPSADLGPLAWVFDELRKSLDAADKAIKRFVRDNEPPRNSDLDAPDPGPLRLARQQIHQGVGALELVGQVAPARVLGAMEAALKRCEQHPQLCDEAAARKLEQTSFALIEYLEAVLNNKPVQPVALFAQYRELQELAGVERVHPSDLWPCEQRSVNVAPPPGSMPLRCDAPLRLLFDRLVLLVVKTQSCAASQQLAKLGAGLSAGAAEPRVQTFWCVAAAYFEAIAQQLLPVDVYVKRVTLRILLQFAALARGQGPVSETLLHDLLFFCSQAHGATPANTPNLVAVREAFGLQATEPVDYQQATLGQYDPAILVQARKSINAAREAWSLFCGGDARRARQVVEQFGLVVDSLLKLHPASTVLAQALLKAADQASNEPGGVRPELAMEVATTTLYLEAAFEDFDPSDVEMTERTQALAARLEQVLHGAPAQPLAPWMEQLYRRVSDRQTMGSVVGELKASLRETEKSLDQFFRDPKEKECLQLAVSQLVQMRGVLSVLGLDQAVQAVARMRATVDQILDTEVDEAMARQAGTFQQLGNNLSALSFLVDMLNYQPALAKKLFVFDEASGELQAIMGRSAVPVAVAQGDARPAFHALVDLPPASAPAAQELQELQDEDLLQVFLLEAREVLSHGREAVRALHTDPSNLEHSTTLRRAFHTLKGGSRMLGLGEFGEAAWAMEQVVNMMLAEQQPAHTDMLRLCAEALDALSRWLVDVAAATDAPWRAQPFRASAEAWRNQSQYLSLDLPWVLDTAAAQTPTENTLSEAESDTEVSNGTQGSADFAQKMRAEALSVGTASAALESPFGEIDFGGLTSLAPRAQALAPDGAPTHWGDDPSTAVQAASELPDGDFDLDWDAHALAFASEPLNAAAPAHPEPELLALAMDDATPAVDFAGSDMPDEQTRVIGSLRIGIKLYNVYLNEADEWSRRLGTELAEWALERHKPVPAQAEALAHSLAGSSAAVGFQSLFQVARALEQAVETVGLHQRAGWSASAEQAELFVAASEDIRRLLHQFATGFLKEPDPDLLDALHRVVHEPQPEGLAPQTAEQPQPSSGPSHALVPVEPIQMWSALTEPQSAVNGRVQDIDDDIDALDTIDLDLFPIFADEAQELLPQLGGALRQWMASPDNDSARAEVLRNLHTLKGSARLAGALRLGEMAHRMETAAEQLGAGVQHSADLEPLQVAFDAISTRFDLLRRTDPESQGVVQWAPEQLPPSMGVLQSPAEGAPALATSVAVAASDSDALFQGDGLENVSLLRTPLPAQGRAGAAVRVRPELLDRLVNQTGEVMITRSRMESEMVTLRGSLKDLTGNLDRLRQQLRDMELQAETQMQSRLAQTRDADQSFDPLEFDRFTRVQELTRMMAESVNDVATVQRNLQRAAEVTEDSLVAQARQTRELQRDLLRTRMVEFEGISERLYRVVRQASKETGKQVRLDITGGQIEMDRGVLDRMTAAFEHLLRNSVVHGIEPPEARLAAGKPAEGRIEIRLAQELNDVSVVFQDDGAGLDLLRLLEKAKALGLVLPSAQLSDDAVAQLVFAPGLSTAQEVSELAGRGIGMDVVRTDVVALGGRIETQTQLGQGTRFKLVLPLTTAITQVVMVRAGSLTLGVPSNVVELVRRVNSDELAQAYAKGSLTVGGEEVPFYWAGALLQSSAQSVQAQGRSLTVVIFRSAAQRVALHFDQVLGNQEVVVKNLGRQLSRLPGLAGMSVLASGAVALIYNPVALAAVYGAQVRAWVASQQQVQLEADPGLSPVDLSASAVPLVLVVDDSITVRRVTQRLLQREGYRVALAADGLQALERLQKERPSVVLSDIEMPRMDGFDLVRNIRNDPRLAALPVIMITSRMAEKHREHARELGVDHYLGKPYAEDELLALIAHYAKTTAEA